MIVEVGPDIVLTLGWPFILTEASLAHKPRILFLNSHPSLLPRHRGFSPFWGAIRAATPRGGSDRPRDRARASTRERDSASRRRFRSTDLTPTSQTHTLRLRERECVGRWTLWYIRHNDAARLLTLFAPQDEKRASWTAKRGSADSEVDPTRPLVDLYDARHATTPGCARPMDGR